MRIAIVGSREVGDIRRARGEIRSLVFCLMQEHPGEVEVVSGGAVGVDHMAESVAIELACGLRVFPAAWNRYGKRAGFLRNQQIVDYCDEIHAWWNGKSKGTKHTIDLARKAGKPVTIHPIPPPASERR